MVIESIAFLDDYDERLQSEGREPLDDVVREQGVHLREILLDHLHKTATADLTPSLADIVEPLRGWEANVHMLAFTAARPWTDQPPPNGPTARQPIPLSGTDDASERSRTLALTLRIAAELSQALHSIELRRPDAGAEELAWLTSSANQLAGDAASFDDLAHGVSSVTRLSGPEIESSLLIANGIVGAFQRDYPDEFGEALRSRTVQEQAVVAALLDGQWASEAARNRFGTQSDDI